MNEWTCIAQVDIYIYIYWYFGIQWVGKTIDKNKPYDRRNACYYAFNYIIIKQA